MPTEQSDRWQRMQRLFAEALALPPDQRVGYLAKQCAGDPEFARQVFALLEFDAQGDAGVEHAIAMAAEDLLAGRDEAPGVWQGRRLGAWRLVAHLADGGMGAVYRAERADGQYEQAAAVKLLNPALISAEAKTRLQAERQILARLNHPNIARLLDGGTSEEGVPYLVMDYVDGVPVDDYCNAQGLDTQARLKLFQQVCAAVDYAHKNLVVHRDLKPGNILVDAAGVPKLLDFGIAKLIESSEATITRADQRLLTPTHASPEQIRGEAVTTATDVYALGVLLYEMLAGRLPYVAAGRTSAQVAREILETEPARPSTAAGDGSNARLDAARRRGEALNADRLRRELEGDLDNIVLMALRKEPERRYASVRALADDIDNFLGHRPVAARADSLAYRSRKFVRRHRLPVAAAVALLLGGALLLLLHTARVTRERDIALQERARADRIADYMVEIFRVTDPSEAGDAKISAREVLDRAARRLPGRIDDDPAMRGRLAQTMGEVYAGLGVTEEAKRWFEAALTDHRAVLPAGDPRIAETLLGLANALRDGSDFRAALARVDEALDIARAVRPADALLVSRVLAQRGFVRTHMSDYKGAVADCEAALEHLGRQRGTDRNAEIRRSVALHCKAEALSRLDRVEEAGQLFAAASALQREHLGDEHLLHLSLLSDWARVSFSRGHYAEAAEKLEMLLAIEERLSGADSTTVAQGLMNLGTTHRVAGDYPKAAQATERAIDIYRRRFGEDTRAVTLGYINLSVVRGAEGRYQEAEALLRRALEIQRRILPAGSDDIASALHNLAWQLAEQDRATETLPLLEEAVAIREVKLGSAHSGTIATLSMLGLHRLDSDMVRGIGEIELAVERARSAGLLDQQAGLIAQQRLAIALRRRGDFERALELHDAIERALVARFGAAPAHLHATLLERARILIVQKRYAPAEAELRRAVDLEHTVYGGDTVRSGFDLVLLAEVKQARGELDDARELARQGHAVLIARLPAEHKNMRHAVHVLKTLDAD